jgi:hypothetical protein
MYKPEGLNSTSGLEKITLDLPRRLDAIFYDGQSYMDVCTDAIRSLALNCRHIE